MNDIPATTEPLAEQAACSSAASAAVPSASPTVTGQSSPVGSATQSRAADANQSTGWRYSSTDNRDLRIDLLRGLAIMWVVANHYAPTHFFRELTAERVGIVTGAEVFVILSGIVLGMVSARRIRTATNPSAAIRTACDTFWRRAGQLYLASVGSAVLIYLLVRLGVDATSVTHIGRSSSFPDGSSPLSDLARFATLQSGSWTINILGLYVILLSVFAPIAIWLLARGKTAWLLAGSGAAYLAFHAIGARPFLPLQFERSFPLMGWQVLFVLGLAGGYHRQRLLDWSKTGLGRLAVAVCIAMAVGSMLYALQRVDSGHDPRWYQLLPAESYKAVYRRAFRLRIELYPGRLANVVAIVVASYALLSVAWKPINATLGWLLVPMGQATLYVFVIHSFLLISADHLPGAPYVSPAANTLVVAAMLLLIWWAVRKRFLFGIIPR